MPLKQILMLIVLGLAAAGAGFMLFQTNNPAAPPQAADGQTKKTDHGSARRPDFSLPDVEGVEHPISEWNNKVILLNFWATWCPPCRREIPAFIKLQDQFGKQDFQVIGVAIDQVDLVEAYADNIGVNYPILVGENSAIKVTEAYGNQYGQLPYTVIIDRQGIIHHKKFGEVTYDEAIAFIQPLLNKPGGP
ncbi:MAG TPA: TlpA family protein disulfide reductase [Gammaproteobacteria bacterium]|nr:TlpA family protein disulfide reductase [Gammaproteobacteria bacterium]